MNDGDSIYPPDRGRPHETLGDAAAAAPDGAMDRDLDELLATACWPEPSPASEQRLRDSWKALQAERPRGYRSWQRVAACGVAAALAVAALLLWQALPSAPIPPKQPVAKRPPERPEPQRPLPPALAPAVAVTWRPALPWEAALVNPRPRPASRPAPAAVGRPDSLIARVNAAVDAAASAPGTDVAALAAALERDFPAHRIEQRLTPLVVGGPDRRRRAAARLLARVATPRSAPLLASLAGNPADRADAVAGLVRVGDVPTLAALATLSADEAERRALLAAMLRRDPARSVPAYLAFLSDPATAGAALAALDDVPAPPVEALFASLNDPRRANRLAAARALGRIDGPAVTARLAAMVRRNVNRHEALAALASSDGPEAKAFFGWALASKEFGSYARTARAGLDPM